MPLPELPEITFKPIPVSYTSLSTPSPRFPSAIVPFTSRPMKLCSTTAMGPVVLEEGGCTVLSRMIPADVSRNQVAGIGSRPADRRLLGTAEHAGAVIRFNVLPAHVEADGVPLNHGHRGVHTDRDTVGAVSRNEIPGLGIVPPIVMFATSPLMPSAPLLRTFSPIALRPMMFPWINADVSWAATKGRVIPSPSFPEIRLPRRWPFRQRLSPWQSSARRLQVPQRAGAGNVGADVIALNNGRDDGGTKRDPVAQVARYQVPRRRGCATDDRRRRIADDPICPVAHGSGRWAHVGRPGHIDANLIAKDHGGGA